MLKAYHFCLLFVLSLFHWWSHCISLGLAWLLYIWSLANGNYALARPACIHCDKLIHRLLLWLGLYTDSFYTVHWVHFLYHVWTYFFSAIGIVHTAAYTAVCMQEVLWKHVPLTVPTSKYSSSSIPAITLTVCTAANYMSHTLEEL